MKKFSKYLIVLALAIFVLLGAFISCDDAIGNAKDEFWKEFKLAVDDKVGDVAVVTYSGDSITVVFRDNITVEEVYDAAEALFGALGDIVDKDYSRLFLDDKTFKLSTANVFVDVAKHLLDGGTDAAEEFLDDGNVTSPYSAKVKYGGVEFDLEGTLKFDIAD